jgi:glycine/D-amino acid oxidase-like deaminating enzyme
MKSATSVLTSDFKTTPYWWEEAPRPPLDPVELPAETDVIVIGSGYTGLSAALTLARAGKQVAVVDAGDLGGGASSRNTGSMGRTFRHPFSALAKSHGVERATEVYREVGAAFDYASAMIEGEKIACHFARRGRFTGFISPKQYDASAREVETRQKHVPGVDVLLSRAEQHREIGFGLYHGGILVPDVASIHPGLYHLGLLALVRKAGATVHAHTLVSDVRREKAGFTVATDRGSIKAGNVIVATNGYTGKLLPFLRRRVIPFPAFIMATEPLGTATVKRLLPTLRIFQEAAQNPFFMRPTPDGERLLFGGLTGWFAPSLPKFARRLHAALVARIPELQNVRISHLWTGKCSATFSIYPGIGVHDGIHYAMGYCFAGISMGTYLGHKIGLRVLGAPEARTVFDDIIFESRAWHQGYPWFVPFAAAQMIRGDRKLRDGIPG